MKALRQKRTVSSRTPKASAIWRLVQPDTVSKKKTTESQPVSVGQPGHTCLL